MRFTKLLPALALLSLLFVACRKGNPLITPASLNLVHALANGSALIPVSGNSAMNSYATALTLKYGNGRLYSVHGGNQLLSLTNASDTTRSFFSGTLDLQDGAMYSLFLCGDTTQPDTVLLQDELPRFTDSLAGVRFIHLSPASQPVNILLKTSTEETPVASNLAYRQASSFLSYPANSSVTGKRYTFEVQDATTGIILLTYNWSYTPYKTETLVFSGYEKNGAASGLNIFKVSHY